MSLWGEEKSSNKSLYQIFPTQRLFLVFFVKERLLLPIACGYIN